MIKQIINYRVFLLIYFFTIIMFSVLNIPIIELYKVQGLCFFGLFICFIQIIYKEELTTKLKTAQEITR